MAATFCFNIRTVCHVIFSTATYPQSLGLIVFMLRQATEHFLRTLDDKQTSSFKLDWVADLSAEDLKEVRGTV